MADLQSPDATAQRATPPETCGEDKSPLTAPLTGTADNGCEPLREPDPDLARVIDAWPDLPQHIRAAVLALVGTAPHP
jgi:hypothetical protein